MTSLAFYAGLLLAVAGVLSAVWPVVIPGGRRGAVWLAAGGLAFSAAALLWPLPPAATAGSPRALIDEAMPLYHFVERHRTRVCASPERIFAAIREVTPAEIRWFGLLATVRGINGGDSSRPLLETATRGGFVALGETPGREIVLGTGGPFWAAGRMPPDLARHIRDRLRGVENHASDFAALDLSGFPKAVIRFRVDPAGRGCQTLSTETRIGAGNEEQLGRFAMYWRVISPGSALLRRMWLDAIRRRAEAR